MITVHDLEVRAGARLLMEHVTFRVGPGDKVGLVGRNGAGKTTMTRILAGEGLPAAGSVQRTGEIGYLPQDPRTSDPEVVALDRILSARGLDDALRRLRRVLDGPAAHRALQRGERGHAGSVTRRRPAGIGVFPRPARSGDGGAGRRRLSWDQ